VLAPAFESSHESLKTMSFSVFNRLRGPRQKIVIPSTSAPCTAQTSAIEVQSRKTPVLWKNHPSPNARQRPSGRSVVSTLRNASRQYLGNILTEGSLPQHAVSKGSRRTKQLVGSRDMPSRNARKSFKNALRNLGRTDNERPGFAGPVIIHGMTVFRT